MRHTAGRKRAVVGLSAGAMLAFAAFAPSASAQVGPVAHPVGSTTRTVTQTPRAVADSVTDAVGPTRGTVGSTTRKVTPVVDPVGAAVDKATGTNTYETTKATLQTTADDIDKTVGDITGPVGQIVEETTGGLGNDPKPDAEKPRDEPGTKNPAPATNSFGPSGSAGRLAGAETGLDPLNRLATLIASERGIDRSIATPAVAPPQRGSLFRDLVEGAGEAAERLAFPLALALMVAAFLIVQGRIDRKDAKLALAPIDAEQDLLSFR